MKSRCWPRPLSRQLPPEDELAQLVLEPRSALSYMGPEAAAALRRAEGLLAVQGGCGTGGRDGRSGQTAGAHCGLPKNGAPSASTRARLKKLVFCALSGLRNTCLR